MLGLELPKLGKKRMEHLFRQGFLVTEKRAKGIADLYDVFDRQDGELATLVTTDSLLEPVMEAAFLVFRASWAEEGRALPPLLRSWIGRLSKAGPGPWPKAWRLAGGILCVSLGILEGKEALGGLPLPEDVLQAAREELDRISRKRTAWSPLLGRSVDYGALSLSSPLPGEVNFGGWASPARLKAWLSQCVLLLDDPVQTRAGLLLAGTAPSGWEQAFSRERSLVGPLDNMGIGVYRDALKRAGGLKQVQAGEKGWGKALAFLKERFVPGKALLAQGRKGELSILVRLAGRNLTYYLPPLSCPWASSLLGSMVGKGLLLDGPGFSPDAEALQWGVFLRPAHPTGLLLAGGVGNSWAEAKAASYCLRFLSGGPWDAQFARGDYDWRLIKEILAPRSGEPVSLQSLFWDLFRAIAADEPPGMPNREWYFSTPAWAERRARTALAGWTLWRRAAGPSVRRCLGIAAASGFRDQGYIIPTSAELDRFRRFVAFLAQAAPKWEILHEPLARVSKLVKRVYELRRKQEQGLEWNRADMDFFAHYGEALKVRKDEGGNSFREKVPHAYACNVGDLMAAEEGRTLEARFPEVFLFAALAPPRRIYALVRIGGKWYLARGGVLDYREFVLPSGMSLDDRGWREVLKVLPEAGTLPDGEGKPGKRVGAGQEWKRALASKNLVLLESALLRARTSPESLDALLRARVKRERKRCRSPWALALTDEKILPPGREGLLFALKVLWKGTLDLTLVPPARRRELASLAGRKAAEEEKFPWSFFRELYREDREAWTAAFEAWLDSIQDLDPLRAGKILLEFLKAPAPGAPPLVPETQRARLAGRLVSKAGKEMETMLLRGGVRLKVLLCQALFWAWSPEGYHLLDGVIQKDPQEFLETTTDAISYLKKSLPEESIRFLQEEIRRGRAGGDLYFRFLYLLLVHGVSPGVEAVQRGWKIFKERFLRDGKGRSGEEGFGPEDCLSSLLLSRPGEVLGWIRGELGKDGGNRAGRYLEKAVGCIIETWDMDSTGTSALPPLPDVFQGGKVTDWNALDGWLREARRRLEMGERKQ